MTRMTKADCLKDLIHYPWAEHMTETDFISPGPSYTAGTYLPLFENSVYHTGDSRIGDLRYFIYDPVQHGMPADRQYPVIFALHGSGGSLAGKLAVNWAGAELFAAPDRQAAMGGAIIIVPLANEYETEEGLDMSWMTPVEGTPCASFGPEDQAAANGLAVLGPHFTRLLGHNSVYTEALFGLLRSVLAPLPHAGRRILFGTSAGGYGAWRLMITDPTFFDAVLMMAGAYLPSQHELDRIEAAGRPLWVCHGRQDECVPFDLILQPILPRLQHMPHVSLYLPELVRRADGGIAVNCSDDRQMGQHCINDVISENMMYSDGSPMDPAHPDGVTGWIRSLCE